MNNPKIVEFEPIPCPDFPHLPDHVLATFSQDQKLLYLICQAVMSGHCSEELASRQIGPYNPSRWVSFSARILMYYMTLENPYIIGNWYLMVFIIILYY